MKVDSNTKSSIINIAETGTSSTHIFNITLSAHQTNTQPFTSARQQSSDKKTHNNLHISQIRLNFALAIRKTDCSMMIR